MSNLYIFTGRMATAPALTQPKGKSVCKFTLIRNEYAGTEEDGTRREPRKVAIPFVAFNAKAEAIAKNVLEGDQLIIEARVENNNYTDGQGADKFGFNFVVEDFEFGAPGAKKREQLAAQNG